jgi:hypothetical protein
MGQCAFAQAWQKRHLAADFAPLIFLEGSFMSHFRLARLCLLLAAVGLNTAPALMTSAHAQKADAAAPANNVRPELFKLLDPAQLQPLLASRNAAELQNRVTQAEAIPNKTPYENYVVNRTKMAQASLAGNDAGVAAAAEEVLKSGFEPKENQSKLVLAIADIQYKLRHASQTLNSRRRSDSAPRPRGPQRPGDGRHEDRHRTAAGDRQHLRRPDRRDQRLLGH